MESRHTQKSQADGHTEETGEESEGWGGLWAMDDRAQKNSEGEGEVGKAVLLLSATRDGWLDSL